VLALGLSTGTPSGASSSESSEVTLDCRGRARSTAHPGEVTAMGRGYFFAAAFAAFLNSRTLVSDSGSTMSATDRYEPSRP